jgi:Protein of unknown function (DUF2892)
MDDGRACPVLMTFQTQVKKQAKEYVMNVDKAVLMFAGFVVLLGLAFGYMVSPYWYLLTAFAGLNMFQASISGFCPAAMVFKKLGLRDGCAFS